LVDATEPRHFYYHCNHCRTTRYRAGDVNDSVVKMLKSLSVSSEVEELFKVIVQLVFNEDQISDAKEKELATKKLDQLNEQIERLDDLLLGGKLKIEDCNSMKEKLSNRLNQLKSKQQIKETEKSEFEEYLFKGVGLLKNFGSAYENYDLDGKHQLLGSTFPEKIIFDGKKCRTTKMNEAVSLIVSVDKGLKKGKKKQVNQKTDLFTIVGPTGLLT
jgi:site-specific DNA recombinase